MRRSAQRVSWLGAQVRQAQAYMYDIRNVRTWRICTAYMLLLCILAIKRLEIYAGIRIAQAYTVAQAYAVKRKFTEDQRSGVSVSAISEAFSGTTTKFCL